jgi:hypothetical protein
VHPVEIIYGDIVVKPININRTGCVGQIGVIRWAQSPRRHRIGPGKYSGGDGQRWHVDRDAGRQAPDVADDECGVGVVG